LVLRDTFQKVKSPIEPIRPAPPASRKSVQKLLPAPDSDLFCPYSHDLQRNSIPLHSNFRSKNNHRCPSCLVKIPVDTRDVWVLSTYFPGKENRHKVREYRMDARFVVKCHAPDGQFACVLCDRHRDMDCICRTVDALVKHLGTAHSPDEFEDDPDMVRMGKSTILNPKARERELSWA
jgi:hypothetical protein